MRTSRIAIATLLAVAGCVSGTYVASPGRIPVVPTAPAEPRNRALPDAILPDPTARDSSFWAQSVDSVRSALSVEVQRALLLQRRAWIAEEFKQHLPPVPGIVTEPESQRAARVHCHREFANGPTPWSPVVIRTVVSSGVSRMSLCPEWIPRRGPDDRAPSHEYDASARDPAQLSPFPRELIAALDSASGLHPTNRFFTGQLVRVLTENRAITSAREVLAACRIPDGWCDLLAGYVAHADGDYLAADSLFIRGIAALPTEERCEWQSVERLLSERTPASASANDCSAQEAFADRFWWLATPLLSKPGNDRRAEHHARVMRNHLVSQLPLDAHYNLRPEKGLDAIVDLRIRYGWPDHQVWGGGDLETEHNLYLLSDAGPPYSSPEYVLTATSTVPARRVVDKPLTVRDTDFELTPNVREPRHWWPHEHLRLPRGSIVAFRAPQYALLRRSGSARLLVAADLRGGQLNEAQGARIEAQLVSSSAPGKVARLVSVKARGGERLVAEATLAEPSIVSFEAEIGVNEVAAARTRFGVAAVPTIESLGSARCAISTPILVSPTMPRTVGSETLLAHMLGTLALEEPTAVGLAWESYGFKPGDTTTVSVSVGRHAEIGTMRSLAMRLGLSGDPRRPISIAWREPDATRDLRPVASNDVPTVLRTLVLNVAQLTEGSYSVSVTMESAGCKATSELRDFSIWR